MAIPEPGDAEIRLTRVVAPLAPDLAWEVESLLVKILEYGDYSFRSALTGGYSETLTCVFILARDKGVLIGAAGCLHSRRNPAIAILGPVVVAPEYRRRGIGRRLVCAAAGYLKAQDCLAVYLGVSKANPAVNLYQSVGFKSHKGIVMRLLLSPEEQFNEWCSAGDPGLAVRPVTWGDFPAVQALAVWPCAMHTFDLPRGIFSSRYCEPARFLSIFPDLMRALARTGGAANVLVAGKRENVVGIAWLRRLPGGAQAHSAEFDAFVQDDHLASAMPLAEATIRRAAGLSVRRITCGCLSRDHIKRGVLERLGADLVATLPEQVCLDGAYSDVHIYQIDTGVGGGVRGERTGLHPAEGPVRSQR